jgi:hypothetical protein
MPDNKQIDETLQYVKNTSPVEIDQLSSDGRKLIQDVRDIIETARLIVQEKNADELLQNFVWHTRDVDITEAKKDPNEVLPVDGEKAKDDGQTGAFSRFFFDYIIVCLLINSSRMQLLNIFARSSLSSSPIPKFANFSPISLSSAETSSLAAHPKPPTASAQTKKPSLTSMIRLLETNSSPKADVQLV